MQTINRSLVVIKPKQPYVDWANKLPDADRKTTLEELQDDCTAILIPSQDSDVDAKKYIGKKFSEIFEDELFNWCINEDWWPENLTEKMFWDWFDVEYHSEIIDFEKGAIKKEEY